MNLRLLYDPRLLVERLAIASQRLRRIQTLRGTPARKLASGHIDSLELLRLLASNPPSVIYDVGANAGTWTCLAKSIYPAALVECFEPLSQFEPAFRHWTASWPTDVRLHRVALGSKEGSAEMVITDFADASSLLPLAELSEQQFGLKEDRRESVQLTTLDHLVAKRSLHRPPDLIKLDVQGYELEVLRGAEQCLATTRAVLCEVSFQSYYVGQPLFDEVLAFLTDRGFALHAFGPNLGLGTPLTQTDALFLRRA